MREKTTAMQKEIGTEELVYATIIGRDVNERGDGVIFTWKHVATGKVLQHDFSKDKAKHNNCYGTLEDGCTYIIAQELVSHQRGGRWVWRKAKLVTPKQAQQVIKMVGYGYPKPIDPLKMEQAMEWVDQQQKQKSKPSLADQLFRF